MTCCAVLWCVFVCQVEPVMKTDYEDEWAWRVENDNKPLWTRSPKEVSEADYNEFFKQVGGCRCGCMLAACIYGCVGAMGGCVHTLGHHLEHEGQRHLAVRSRAGCAPACKAPIPNLAPTALKRSPSPMQCLCWHHPPPMLSPC